ncbi:MAG TPA: Mu transposase C-terminal domain-containing protein, partial [Fibrobacteria bacterium]|nr:Mu transposase C-terminal domain-containing protein [Fibrobacteria bacterium]
MGEALRIREEASSILDDAWVSVDEAAQLMRTSSRTIRRRLAEFAARTVPRSGSGGDRHEIAVGSLPPEAITRWEARQRLEAQRPQDAQGEVFQAYERADQRTRRHFDRWSQVLLATQEIKGRRSLEEWCAKWSAVNPENPVTVQSLYRVRAQVAEHGMLGLLLRDTKLARSTVADDAFQAFCDAYLNEGKLSLADAHLAALGASQRLARDSGQPFDPESFPSQWAFQRRLEKEFSPAVIAFKRDGEKKFFDRWGYYIERDYSDLIAGRIWVGDSRVLDLLVQAPGFASPVRPWVTLYICMKSYYPMGWHVHLDSPSAENTMRAIRHGILRMGKPEWLYLDNGREHRNREVTGLVRGKVVNYDHQDTGSIAAVLGIQVHLAEAHRSRAKPIERQFLDCKKTFDRFWTTFKGGNAVEKPNRLKEVLHRSSQVPTFEQVREELNHFYEATFPHRVCNGKTHRGRTRAQVLEADFAQHGPLPQVSADTASLLVSKMARGRIGRRGFHLASLGVTWWAEEWMPEAKGREVVLRYDPDDLRAARVYEATATGHGSLLGVAYLEEAVGAKVSHDDPIGRAQMANKNRAHKGEIKLLRKLVPQADADDLARIRKDYALGVG